MTEVEVVEEEESMWDKVTGMFDDMTDAIEGVAEKGADWGAGKLISIVDAKVEDTESTLDDALNNALKKSLVKQCYASLSDEDKAEVMAELV